MPKGLTTYANTPRLSLMHKRMTLQEALDARGWTQEQLEAASGVDQRNISKIKRGDIMDPRNSTVEKLETALGLKRGTLVFGQREAVA
jgi:transcriptional regulator with XRE-family HTH domain